MIQNDVIFFTVPARCPATTTVTGCSTCCCMSSSDVEFYQPSMAKLKCMVPAAVYEVRFVASWTSTCQPDYYFNNAHWSRLTGISHKPEYELWDACMHNVSPGVALVSQTGDTSKKLSKCLIILCALKLALMIVSCMHFYPFSRLLAWCYVAFYFPNSGTINEEYARNSQYILDRFDASLLISGAGNVTSELKVDSQHQYVSVVTMLVPSADRMMGVSLLRLCAGSQWRQMVRLCGELFSTATKSERVSDTRNSIQSNNCSFGYFEFNYLRYIL